MLLARVAAWLGGNKKQERTGKWHRNSIYLLGFGASAFTQVVLVLAALILCLPPQLRRSRPKGWFSSLAYEMDGRSFQKCGILC